MSTSADGDVAVERAGDAPPTEPAHGRERPPESVLESAAATAAVAAGPNVWGAGVVDENDWRNAMMKVCADLQGKTIEALDAEYKDDLAMVQYKANAFAVMPADRHPRDLVDFVIMTTLQTRDSFNAQNARSWMFNLMDRTGQGYVFRDEFIRYASLMQPVADPAVASSVFRELVNPQFSGTAEDETTSTQHTESAVPDVSVDDGARNSEKLGQPAQSIDQQNSSQDAQEVVSAVSGDSIMHQEPTRASAPPQVTALMYETWKSYVEKLKKVYNRNDPEWENAKDQLGIDPLEPLVKAQPAIDHSDVFPTPGKLFLSERYLVFFASMGTRHYVIRLGSINDVEKHSLPVLMRDCIRVTLEPEARSHLKGLAGEVSGGLPPASSSSTASRPTNSLAMQAANTVRIYSISGDPFLFSFHEFRVAKRREVWLTYLREMLAAHRLHASFGFGAKGRPPANPTDWGSPESQPSPFRHDAPPPLFAVGAAVNILRSRALKTATGKRTSRLMLFSNIDDHSEAVKWYSDSIQAFDSAERRSWVTRAMQSIVENMEINSRIYEVNEDEPFDVTKLGEGIARFYELTQPAFTVYYAYERLMQWRNPPATVLALIVCFYIAYNNLTMYIPSLLLLAYSGLIVGFRVKLVGFKGTDAAAAAASAQARSQGMFELVTQVHDALHAAQNVFVRMNKQLGRMQTLHIWGIPGMSWVYVGTVLLSALLVAIVPFRILFILFCLDSFTRHFRYPDGATTRFWENIPSNMSKFDSRGTKKTN